MDLLPLELFSTVFKVYLCIGFAQAGFCFISVQGEPKILEWSDV